MNFDDLLHIIVHDSKMLACFKRVFAKSRLVTKKSKLKEWDDYREKSDYEDAMPLFERYLSAKVRDRALKSSRLVKDSLVISEILEGGTSFITPSLTLKRTPLDSSEFHVLPHALIWKSDGYELCRLAIADKPRSVDFLALAYQLSILSSIGVKIKEVTLFCINKDYTYNGGEIDVERFFIAHKISINGPEFQRAYQASQDIIDGYITTLGTGGAVSTQRGLKCLGCEFFEECIGSPVPEKSIGLIFDRDSKTTAILADNGAFGINDLDDDLKLSPNQALALYVAKTGRAVFDKGKLSNFLKNLIYPIIDFDYETVSFAVPRYIGTRPFEQIPFQFTLQIEQKLGGEVLVHNVVNRNLGEDPRPFILSELKKAMPISGSVVVWHKSFEEGVNQRLGDFDKGSKEFVDGINMRLIDLRIPFFEGMYMLNSFNGSTSLKAVTKALIPENDYENLEINNGIMASVEYQKLMDTDISEAKKNDTIKKLINYCDKDGENVRLIRNILLAKCG